MNEILKKKRVLLQGKEGYFLGTDENGERFYLMLPSWDCGHYWGCGYLSAYGGTRNTENNWSMHTHFKGHIIGQQEKYDNKKQAFVKTRYTHHPNEVLKHTVLSDSESWILSELISSMEILKEASSFYNKGGSHMTKNPIRKFLINDKEYRRINKVLLPKLFKEIDKLLKGKGQETKTFKLLDEQINPSSGGRY